MARPTRFFVSALLCLAALAASPVTRVDEVENYRQLQTMPRERRVALSENLERYDKLDPAEQTAIRKLNAEILEKDPVEQLRYRAILRQYHLWVNGLTDKQKEELKAIEDPEARFKLARRFRLKELEGATSGPRIAGIRTGFYGLIGPYEAAHLLRTWSKLTLAKKAEIEREQEQGHLFAEIRKAAQTVSVHKKPFPNAEEKHYDTILEENEGFKKQLGQFANRPEARKKAAGTPAKGESAQNKKAEATPAKEEPTPKRFELRFAEFLYFEDHKPKSVSQQNLERFSAASPAWLHAMLDPLSPDEARTYLTILYRLIYTDDADIPSDTKPARPATSATSGVPKPGTRKSSPAAPF